MDNDFKKIIIKVICFVLIGFLLIQILSKIFIPKWITPLDNRMSYIVKGFYEEKENSLDVIFMGNSDVYRGISPVTLWDEYGIASYNYVSSGQRMWTAYYMLVECLKYQKPKLIVLNMDSAFNESKSSESNYRKIFDNMRFSVNKLNAITDKTFKFKLSDKISYIFPIFRFHSRWSELTDTDIDYAFKKNSIYYSYYKGMDPVIESEPYTKNYEYMEKDDSDEKIGEKCSKYLNMFIDLCNENNIPLLLIEIPSAESWSQDLSEKTLEFANEKGLDFIDMNLNASSFGFDWTTDTADAGDHLNVNGATKVSKYIGKILITKYGIPDRRNDEDYKEWYNVSKQYHEDIAKLYEEKK